MSDNADMGEKSPKKSHKAKAESKPLNAYYVSAPFIFKTTGEVRRCKSAPRYTRKLNLDAMRLARSLEGCTHLVVTDDTCAYILNADQTALLMQDAANIPAMYFNGWAIRPATDELISLLPPAYQL